MPFSFYLAKVPAPARRLLVIITSNEAGSRYLEAEAIVVASGAPPLLARRFFIAGNQLDNSDVPVDIEGLRRVAREAAAQWIEERFELPAHSVAMGLVQLEEVALLIVGGFVLPLKAIRDVSRADDLARALLDLRDVPSPEIRDMVPQV